MSRRLPSLVLLGAALLFAGAFTAYRGRCDRRLAEAAAKGDVRVWLSRALGLDEPTILAVLREQEIFRPQCETHCREIREARAALRALPGDASADRRRAAEKLVAERTAFCEAERIAQVRRLAALMPADAGERYLQIVLPRLRSLDHSGAPDAAGRP